MTRFLSGAVLVALAVGIVWFAHPLLFLAVAEALLALAFVEYAKLAAAGGTPIPFFPALAATMLTSLGVGATHWVGDRLVGTGVALDAIFISGFVALAAMTLTSWKGERDALARAAAAVFPMLYLGLPIGSMLAIRTLRGREVLFLLMLVVMASDTAQYYTGRAFGQRLLAPSISPKKTIEGGIGGMVMSVITAIVTHFTFFPEFPLVHAIIAGALLSVSGMIGDLAESMWKRSANVKDSGTLLPGHGGFLDRFDSIFFTAPILYTYWSLIVRNFRSLNIMQG